MNTYHRDGAMRVDGNQSGVPGVRPNSFGRWAEQPQYAEPAGAAGAVADRFDYREDDDNLFRLDEGARQRLLESTARGIKGARKETVERHIDNCAKADPAYGAGVRKACEETGVL